MNLQLPETPTHDIVGKFCGTATVIKENRRLWIVLLETNQKIYSPPNQIVIPSRHVLQTELADAFTEKQERCINAIMAFETKYTRK